MEKTGGGLETPPCTGTTPDALPKVHEPVKPENSHTGVSTSYVQNANNAANPKEKIHWFVLRTTYGREKKANEYLTKENVETFYPTITTIKVIKGKKKAVKVSRLPNILFARGTEIQIKAYVYDNVNLPYLRFYYDHITVNGKPAKVPLVVPDREIASLKIICAADSDNVITVNGNVEKFKQGQMVRVTNGAFTGVIGKVARYHGQQRVAVIINQMITMCTAYIPSAFLEPLDTTP
ncbi:MAG: UpxY family transcription antiterminator [Muribaculaceae bacterium]